MKESFLEKRAIYLIIRISARNMQRFIFLWGLVFFQQSQE
ncbi:hypothetical protein P872_05015 [Rhodonellum psychrophilum GCM71 = DSM 17998]|uniref:Uncharacterized protein n=1 Tax=Rhodonellum psychrophilum GCM71 = DSM 17998 TaxID=1123057 RepID=U5C227_9BACT|nr:hypothetical protein P872_05015 [Rhodonellum psychrophilum GCM71 = DSM 17998]